MRLFSPFSLLLRSTPAQEESDQAAWPLLTSRAALTALARLFIISFSPSRLLSRSLHSLALCPTVGIVIELAYVYKKHDASASVPQTTYANGYATRPLTDRGPAVVPALLWPSPCPPRSS